MGPQWRPTPPKAAEEAARLYPEALADGRSAWRSWGGRMTRSGAGLLCSRWREGACKPQALGRKTRETTEAQYDSTDVL